MNQQEVYFEEQKLKTIQLMYLTSFASILISFVFFFLFFTHRSTDFIVMSISIQEGSMILSALARKMELDYQIETKSSILKFTVFFKIFLPSLALLFFAIWLGYF